MSVIGSGRAFRAFFCCRVAAAGSAFGGGGGGSCGPIFRRCVAVVGRIGASRRRFFCWRMALAAMLIGVLDLKVGARLKEVKSEGVDLMVALDVSTSMEAEDTGSSRIDLAKQSIQRLVNTLDGDRMGLVIFAGDAFVQCPITTDYGALKLFLDGVTADLVPVQGTAVGRAIEVCTQGFDPESPASKMIVVFTDGENHEARKHAPHFHGRSPDHSNAKRGARLYEQPGINFEPRCVDG